MAVTQQLEIDIKAKSDKATASLDALIGKLNEVNSALNGLNTQKINEISNSMKGLKGVHLNTGSKGGGGLTGGITTRTISQTKKGTTAFQQLLSAVTGARRGLGGFSGTMANLAAKWGMFYAAMYPVIRLFKFFGKEVEESMDYVETFNFFKVTMSKIGHDAGEGLKDEFLGQINDLNKKMTGFRLGKNGELIDMNMSSLGLNPSEMMKFQAQIGAVTNSLGLMGQVSVNTQKALSMLSADLSSLKNEDLESVMKNLNSGLIGQSRVLYKYGIDITNATLKQYALQHGITKSVSAMSQSEKVQLRLLAILDQSKVAWGDQANSINTVANQYRIMKQQIANLGRTIGNLFLPVVKAVLPYLNAFIIAMRKIFELLGHKIYGGNWKKELMEGVSEGNFSGMTEEIEDTEDALNGATKAAKKFKQATMGFDELNIINTESGSGASGGSGGGGGFDLSGDIEDALKEYEDTWDDAFNKMQNKAEELANKFVNYIKEHDYFGLGRWISDGIASGLENIPWNSIKSEAEKAGKGLAELMNGLMSARLSWDIGYDIAEGLNTAFTFVNSWAKNFSWSEFGKNLAIGLRAFIVTWDAGLTGETFSSFAKGVLEGITSALNTTIDRKTFKAFGQKVVDFICGIDWSGLTWDLLGFFNAFYDAMIEFPSQFAEGILQEILTKIFGDEKKAENIIKNTHIGKVINDVVTLELGGFNPIFYIKFALKKGWTTEDEKILKESKGKVAEAIANGGTKTAWGKIRDYWRNRDEKMAEIGGNLGKAFSDKFGYTLTDVKDTIKDFPQKLQTAFEGMSLGDIAYAFGKEMGKSLAKGLKAFSETKEKIIDIAEYIFISPTKLPQVIAKVFKKIKKAIQDFDVKDLVQAIKDKLSEVFSFKSSKDTKVGSDGTDGFLREFCDRFNEVIESNKSKLEDIGKNIFLGIIDFFTDISKLKKAISEAVQNFFDGMDTGIREVFGIHSPATAMMPLGEFIFLGIVEGFKNKFDSWQEAIEDWFNNDVKPWFTKDRWVELGNGIKDGLTEKWNDFKTWWTTTGFYGWWTDDVSPWFTKKKWSEFGDNVKDALTEKWNEFVEWWSTTGIVTWWTEHVEPYFTEEKWTFEGIEKGLKAAFKAGINAMKKLWNDFADWINENLTWHIDPVEIAGVQVFGGADISLAHLPKFTIPAYSIGGFPEDGLFYANHNELVGQFSNGQTTVANNEQIIAGIQNGVAQAVAQTMMPVLRQIANNTGDTANNTDAIKNKPTQNITDRGIAKANLRGQRSLGLTLRTT